MPKIPSPTQQPELWDRCWIGGVRVPGVVRVSGGHSRRDDNEPVPGQDGVTTTILGYQPAEFNLDILLWTDKDFSDYMEFYQRFRPRKNEGKAGQEAARALTVSRNGGFQTADVTQLTIYEITVPRWQANQQYTASVKLREFIPDTKRKKGTVADKKGKVTKVKDTGQDPNLARATGIPPSKDPTGLHNLYFPTPPPVPGIVDTYSLDGMGL